MIQENVQVITLIEMPNQTNSLSFAIRMANIIDITKYYI